MKKKQKLEKKNDKLITSKKENVLLKKHLFILHTAEIFLYFVSLWNQSTAVTVVCCQHNCKYD